MDEAVISPPRQQGWLVVIATAMAVVVAIGVGVSIAKHTPVETAAPAVAEGPTRPQRMDASVNEWGIQFGTEATFDETVTLSAPTLSAGTVEVTGSLWPLDGQEHEGEDLDPLRLSAGNPVLIGGQIRPPCDDSDIKITISAVSQNADGEKVVHRYPARNTEALAAATRRFCGRGPTVRGAMNRIDPDGDAIIGVNVMNPGPDEITIEVPAYADEHVTWTPIVGTVPAGEMVRFEIYGTQVGCEPGEEASWEEGRLLLDGEPFVVTSSDAWC